MQLLQKWTVKEKSALSADLIKQSVTLKIYLQLFFHPDMFAALVVVYLTKAGVALLFVKLADSALRVQDDTFAAL